MLLTGGRVHSSPEVKPAGRPPLGERGILDLTTVVLGFTVSENRPGHAFLGRVDLKEPVQYKVGKGVHLHCGLMFPLPRSFSS